jgi:ribonuclease PH
MMNWEKFLDAPFKSVKPFPPVGTEKVRNKTEPREANELRPSFFLSGATKTRGTCWLEQGKTKVFCKVNGPMYLSKRLQNPENGTIRVLVDGNLVEMDKEYSNIVAGIIKQAITPIICLDRYPGMLVDINVYILDADGSILTACINTVGNALAHAGIEMMDLVVASSCVVTFDSIKVIYQVDPDKTMEQGTFGSRLNPNFAKMSVSYAPKLEKILWMDWNWNIKNSKSIILEFNEKCFQSARDNCIASCKLIGEWSREALIASFNTMTIDSTTN